MKKVLLFFVFVSISVIAKTQGNLQFNQIVTIVGNVSCSQVRCTQASNLYTVPEGKVWKIESVGYYVNKSQYYYGTPYLIINNNSCYGVLGNNLTGSLINSPIWLKKGDVLQYAMTHNDPNSGFVYTVSFHISIIEFNIIP
jgi:hypothetical protein